MTIVPDDQHHGHHGDDDGESFLRIGSRFSGEEAGVDRDERDRRCAAGDEVVEPIGQGEGGDVGVGLRAGTEGLGDVGFADVSDDARDHDGGHQQQRCGKRGVLMRWP